MIKNRLKGKNQMSIFKFIFRFVKKSLERVCANLQGRALPSLDDMTLKSEFERQKQQREAEWNRLHQGMDAVLAHRRTYTDAVDQNDENDDDEERNIDQDFAIKAPTKRKPAAASTTRGRGRGRGARGASAAPALPLSTEAPQTNSFSAWPPRS